MQSQTTNNAVYKLNSDYSNLNNLRDFITEEAGRFGFDSDTAYLIALAVDEACTNLIRYAYKFDQSKKIEINIKFDNNSFIVVIIDTGKPFNPLDVPPPDMQEYFDEFKRGGLGIFIIRKIMDKVIYKAANDVQMHNELWLLKNLKQSD
jgi:serine/threonine-protein kinase RsbW